MNEPIANIKMDPRLRGDDRIHIFLVNFVGNAQSVFAGLPQNATISLSKHL
ncbi:Uncharacterised protein [Legionella bozemanae]|uniref:Uncharacterized protein n=1 Tax=Legionella bozemanae TaxID=447 RepID=A0A0W0RFB3_LEGBO|nr:hypothetical protein Lboz_3208 [Legionella bozemanae]STO33178.1 Uncharacterised protein [Legionella bozemanae]